MRKFIEVKLNVEGLHHWPGCDLPNVEYLKDLHRHTFQISCTAEVSHGDRDIEFIDFKHKLRKYIANKWYDTTFECCNFGAMSSFSTYFGHTMSTIEGGFITTNNEEIYNLLKMFRSHGWDRDLSLSSQKELRAENNVNDFDALYTFYVPGFNVRSTDLQAFIGIGQLKKVDSMIEQRNKNFKRFKDNLLNKVWFPTEIDNTYTASFCIPVIANSPEHKQKLIKEFGENGIECRPLISGTMSNQPFYKKVYEKKYLPNCQKIDGLGMYIPNHPLLTNKEIDLMCKIIIENIV